MSAKRSAIWFLVGVTGGVLYAGSSLILLGFCGAAFALGYRSGKNNKEKPIPIEPKPSEYMPALDDLNFYSGHGFNRRKE